MRENDRPKKFLEEHAPPAFAARPAAINVASVSQCFGASTDPVLSDVSLQVAVGQFVTVVGPSGCGKSTLLTIIAGLMKSSAGQVHLNGRRVDGPQPDQVGVVFQDATLLPWKTAVENIEFPLLIRGIGPEQRRERAESLLDLVGLKAFANYFPDELSGGMRQRVGIARGLVNDPSILLMDEPFSALDEQSRVKMGYELLQIWEKTRKAILFITHSLVEAIYLSDIVIVMGASPGRVLATIEIDIPRPRSVDVMGSAQFGEYRNKIWHMIAGDEI